MSKKTRAVTRTKAGRNGGTLTPFDSTRAVEAARRRWEKANLAIRKGIAKAGEQIPEIKASDSFRVIEALAESHALNAFDASARGSTSSFDILLKRGFPLPSESGGVSPAPAVDDLELKELLAEYRKWKAQKARETNAGVGNESR